MEKRLYCPLSVVMPVCDEIGVIDDVVDEWHREVFQYLPQGSEMIFDDGASTDGTIAKLESLQKTRPYIRILYSKKDGFAASARRLYREAKCPLVFFTDSDGQYVPSEFWKVAAHAESFDIVHGAKVNRKDPMIRKIASFFFNHLSEWIFASGIQDVNSAFRIVKRSVIENVLPQVHCMPSLFNAELLIRARAGGYKIKQVDVVHRPRLHGVSRGIPPARFGRECLLAYRGLKELRGELNACGSSAQTIAPVSARA